MAKIPEEDLYHLRNLEDKRQTQPKENWEVPIDAWRVFDRLFTQRVIETKKIFTDKDYHIDHVDGVIIMGLIQYACSFLGTIKISKKNEFTKNGNIGFEADLSFMINHCLRNDLTNISFNTELLIDYNGDGSAKGEIEKHYEEIFSLIKKLKYLTMDHKL